MAVVALDATTISAPTSRVTRGPVCSADLQAADALFKVEVTVTGAGLAAADVVAESPQCVKASAAGAVATFDCRVTEANAEQAVLFKITKPGGRGGQTGGGRDHG